MFRYDISEDIIFYETDSGIVNYTMEISEGTLAEEWQMPFGFTYDGSRIVLHTSSDTDTDSFKIYAGSRFGVAVVGEDNMSDMNENFTGNFIAASGKQKTDIDGDGKDDLVYYSAKTDIRSIQTNSSLSPLLRDDSCAFEPGMLNARKLVLYCKPDSKLIRTTIRAILFMCARVVIGE